MRRRYLPSRTALTVLTLRMRKMEVIYLTSMGLPERYRQLLSGALWHDAENIAGLRQKLIFARERGSYSDVHFQISSTPDY